MTSPNQNNDTLAEMLRKFWCHVAKGDCWNWTGYVSPKGYGRIYLNGRLRIAHRLSLELTGAEIPKGMVVDHKCRNRKCVNPEHLRIVSPKVNALENSIAPHALNKKKTHCVNGHALSGHNLIMRQPKKGGPERVCVTCKNSRHKEWQRKRRLRGESDD